MTIEIKISGDQVTPMNQTANTLVVAIHLELLWGLLVPKYKQVYVGVVLQIPTIVKGQAGIEIPLITETEVNQCFELAQIKDQQVRLTLAYPGELDPTREIVGKALVTGYTQSGVVKEG
ncbi:MAG: hypothetical protein ACRCTE_13755 [Cellulosilyticaceae bacterium]